MKTENNKQQKNSKMLSASFSDCCFSEMILPDLDEAEQMGSLWKSYSCYICKKCGKACEPVVVKEEQNVAEETLEEAAKKFSDKFLNNGDNSDFESQAAYLGFIESSKWLSERMYSEKEVWRILCKFDIEKGKDLPMKEFDEWFEKNLKKK